MPPKMSQGLTIGDLSNRTGLAVSAIRFYETHGIVHPVRNAGGHRRYGRHDLRRLSFVMAAQRIGFGLAEIAWFADHTKISHICSRCQGHLYSMR